MKEERRFVRMTLNQRIQHIVLMLSFFTLVVTGFPVTFPESSAAAGIVRVLGGFTMRAALHRAGAIALICLSVYHVFYMLFTRYGRAELRALCPNFRDAQDSLDMIKFYLGLAPRPPQFDRYNFVEKFEYIALAWGSAVMILTGLMLWFETEAMLVLPKWALDVAKVIHSYEALLAFLAIIIWHFYHVHLNPEVFPMSKVWLTGEISEHELENLHPLEYARIIKGETTSTVSEVEKERQTVSCAGGCKNDIREWLHRPIRLPMMRRAISLWTILLLFVFVAAGTVGGIVVTNRSVYCFRCHDMKLYYQTWRVSSHKRIKCEECHAMPGVGDTIRSRISLARLVEKHTNSDAQACPIKGQVPDANCKKCHSSTHDVVVYHGLKITHKNHWDMGIGCTFCHSRVVHGPNAATKNTPTMATCFKCHDGNKASNNCGTCHETLGLRRPALFSEVWVSGHKREVAGGRKSCKRCHQPNFCDNCHRMAMPHSSKFLEVHNQEAAESKQNCKICHNESYCSECHKVKRAHELGWMDKHATVFRKQGSSCKRCHERRFCIDCHVRYRPHPDNWESEHSTQARSAPEKCKTCHQSSFCVGCHSGKTPRSHQDISWARTHGRQSSQLSNCSLCHNSDFCLKCHQRNKPTSHKRDWLETHAIEGKSRDKACQICHTQQSCDRCHGLPMPHPKAFKSGHSSVAPAKGKLCLKCHDKSDCASCHRGTRPANHVPSWISHHGQTARISSDCDNCHSKPFCDNCHQNTMPLSHANEWRKKHGKVWASSATKCTICHSKQSCDNCHGGVQMPHPAKWKIGHREAKESSLKSDSVCYKCHTESYCQKCHSNY